MLYNNPIAYKVDFLPVQVSELLDEHENLHAIKESSADVRRVAALREIVRRIACAFSAALTTSSWKPPQWAPTVWIRRPRERVPS